MSKELVRREWHGDELKARSKRANGRAIVGMAEHVIVEMETVVHVESGTLKRSLHAARTDTEGTIDATPETARQADTKWSIEVGSWIAYACVENERGGTHRFADIGWQLAEPTFDPTLVKAWADEGLR